MVGRRGQLDRLPVDLDLHHGPPHGVADRVARLLERHQLDLGLRAVGELDRARLADVEVDDPEQRRPRRRRRAGRPERRESVPQASTKTKQATIEWRNMAD